MDAGRLRNRVELQRVSVTPDSHGDQVKAWSTLATVWADVLPLTGREFLQASQVMADATATIVIRGPKGGGAQVELTPKDRVLFGARVFDIRQVTDRGGRGVRTELLCTEHF